MKLTNNSFQFFISQVKHETLDALRKANYNPENLQNVKKFYREFVDGGAVS